MGIEREVKGKSGKLEIEQGKGVRGEAKGRDEVAPKLEGMGGALSFDIYCRVRFLESTWSRLFSSHSTIETTSLSPMQFTHNTTGCTHYDSFAGSTLQMYSIQVTEIKDALKLQWPLDVYGMVAVRDTVDGNRNFIFLRKRREYQRLTQKDPCLHLTGPSRAIVFTDFVDFDIELKVKGRTESEDRVLMSQTFKYNGIFCYSPMPLFNDFCKIALHFEKLEKTVQATIMGVRVTGRRRTWPFKHGGRVTCFAKGFSEPGELEAKHELSKEVVLQDQVRANHSNGYVDLSRHVVSVELGGTLEVIIREWSESAAFTAHQVHVFFKAQEGKISQETCYLGHSEVEVTVAWSLLACDKLVRERDELIETNSGLLVEKMEIEGDAKGKSGESVIRGIEQTKSQSSTETVRAEIYSYLDLISKNVMRLKPKSKLRISCYSSSEIQIHLDNMRSEVTNLLQMMESVHNWEIRSKEPAMEKMGIQIRTDDKCKSAKENFSLHRKSILKNLEQIHTMLIKMETRSYKEETRDSLTKAKGGDEEMTEEECFDQYRCSWVSNWSCFCGTFTETTTLSPMHFTHSTPGHAPFGGYVASTLQMYSIKVMEIKDALELNWPLQVYGVVAARDTVDRNRNILFSRQRDDYQELSQKNPFLRLTGPSRAIVTEDPVHVEIELKVKGRTKSEDRVLMSQAWYYSSRLCPLYTPLDGQFCTLVLSSEELKKSVQATIVGVRVTEGMPWPFKYGGRVVCFSRPHKVRLPDSIHTLAPSFRQVVLEDGAMAMGSNGYLGLSRQVVSVELYGRLEVGIYVYSQSRGTAAHSRGIAAQSHVSIKPQRCNVTRHTCCLDNSKLEITIAWSRLVCDKNEI